MKHCQDKRWVFGNMKRTLLKGTNAKLILLFKLGFFLLITYLCYLILFQGPVTTLILQKER